MASAIGTTALLEELQAAIAGQVRYDALSRTLYATDGSIYEILPDAVVLPRRVADVAAAVRLCGRHGVPITPRGAGTGLTGGAVNRGIVLDCSAHLNRILAVDPQARTARVEPGVVLDELNARLLPTGLHFAPDVATSSRATVGGMIGNNSCGAHSIIFGRTDSHVLALDVVLSDGTQCTWGATAGSGPAENALAQRCEQTLEAVARECAAEIAARFPKILRSSGGYALNRLRVDEGGVNAEAIICGSEGTLGIVVRATLKLTPLPRHKGLVVVHYEGVLPALASVPAILRHSPAGVELVDRVILEGAKANPALARRRWFLQGEPPAILIVEIYEEDGQRLHARQQDLIADLRAGGVGYAWPVINGVAQQADVWEVRKAGLGLAMSKPGDVQPHAFVEDTAVDPARLHDYIKRFGQILAEEGVTDAGYYAHASVGLLHARPLLNLKRREDVVRMRRIAERISSLVQEFGGAMTGEHGDGIVRSEWLGKLYGPQILAAFGRIKRAFDPQGILNPGKIVDPLPMDSHLRYGEGYAAQQPPTVLDFGAYGGLAGLAEMCSGVGQCRQRLVGTMCPSYMATGDETHTTRARANALRVALSNRGLLEGLADPALDEVFDLCLSCKACKTECPTGTDVAKLKAEWLNARNRRLGVPRRSRLVGRTPELAVWGQRLAPLSNWLMHTRAARVLLEHWYGLDRRVPLPRFARATFRQWFGRRRGAAAGRASQAAATPATHVVYFVDTWANFYTPQVGIAAVQVLEALGCQVLVPPTVCCGRPLLSKGLLGDARRLAERNIALLAPYAERGVPIVGTEPSCVSALSDEWPQLVRTPETRRVAELAQTVETFVARSLADRPAAFSRGEAHRRLLYHGHCHQKALTGTADAMAVLKACTGGAAAEINSGCCGMAGSFGHEVEHYEIARAIGEQRLFPAIRARGEAEIAVSGFSCRQQIEQHTEVPARHLIEYVAEALLPRGRA